MKATNIKNINNTKEIVDDNIDDNLQLSFKSIFWTKEAYRSVANQFYPCHSHELNLLPSIVIHSMLALMGLCVCIVLFFVLWTIYYRKRRIVRNSSPIGVWRSTLYELSDKLFNPYFSFG